MITADGTGPVPRQYFEEHRVVELNSVRHLFPPGKRVLDVGAGAGFLAALVREWGCDVSAIDVRLPPPDLAHFPVQQYSGRFPFGDGEFDVVLVSHVLAQVEDLRPLFAEIRRVTRPAGVCVFIVPAVSSRFWQFFTHYPARIRRLIRIAESKVAGTEAGFASPLWRRILNTFVPPPLGASPTAFHELGSFRRKAWRHLLEENGFRVERLVAGGVFYTPYLLFRFLTVGQRMALARVFGSATVVIVARPGGEGEALEREPRDLPMKLRRAARRIAGVPGGPFLTAPLRSWWARDRRAITIDDFDGDLRFNCRLDSHITAQIFWNGGYSRRQLSLLRRLLRPDDVFFDVGANEGEQTVMAARRVPLGRVVSFEPLTEIRQRLEANISANRFTNVTVEPMALSDFSGERPIYRSGGRFTDGSCNEGLGTLYPREDVRESGEVVRVTTLDDYVARTETRRIDVMKIDVEGAEYALLRGAARTIRELRPMIILEMSEETAQAAGTSCAELLDLVRSWDYEVYDILRFGRLRLSRGTPTLDVLCAPRGVDPETRRRSATHDAFQQVGGVAG